MGARAVFLDRDGVLNTLVARPRRSLGPPWTPGEVEIPPSVPAALRRLRASGWKLVVVSNQPDVALGKADLQSILDVHAEISGRLGDLIDLWSYCPHHPEGEGVYAIECDCRKPKPGMLLSAAEDLGIDVRRSWMIGDDPRDVAAGMSAGCRGTVRIVTPYADSLFGLVAPDLSVAAKMIW